MSAPMLRIGELARRAGVPPATLRAWERRYGIVEPRRTESGYRLYSDEDERRLRSMVDLITRGVAPAEAAERVLAAGGAAGAAEASPGPADGGTLAAAPEADADGGAGASTVSAAALRSELLDRLVAFDETGAHRALDRAIDAYAIETLIGEVVLPVLRRIGDLWHSGELEVGGEHFASNVIRGRLLGLARGWDGGDGPLALLACPPGEGHELGLLCLGLLLRERGWRIAFLGADTPLATLSATAERLRPRVVVLPLTDPEAARRLSEVGALELGTELAIGGAGADDEVAAAIGARLLEPDVVAAATALAGTVRST